MLLNELNEKGFVYFSTDIGIATLDIATSIGNIYKVSTMPLIQTLTPRLKKSELDNTYSGNFGIGEFPFHTDLAHWFVPPRYFLLRCIVPAMNVYTKLIDSEILFSDSESILLNRSHFKSRKKLDRTTNILKLRQERIFRWDSVFIKPINKNADRLSIIMDERVNTVDFISFSLCEEGDCLLIDNWRMLHSRSPVSEESMDRKIERVYFEEITF